MVVLRSVGLVYWLALITGCAGASNRTELAVQVSYQGAPPLPSSVTVSVFDPHGLIGHQTFNAPPLPGEFIVNGLPDRAVDVRIAADGTALTHKSIGGARVTLVPQKRLTLGLTLSDSTADSDGDGVPDAIDDCPTVPDADQADSTGVPPGDACRGAPGSDLAASAGGDLARSPGDLGAIDIDMAGAPPPDMMRPPSSCGSVTAFCDGFEGPGIASHWVTILQVGGSVSIDTSRAYRGSSSLHLHNDAIASGNSDVALGESQTFASHFYLRAFVYVPSGFDPSTGDIFFTEQNASPYEGITLNLYNGSFETNDTIPGGGEKNSTTPMPTNTWVCLEWNVQLGTSSGSPNGSTALGVGASGTLANNLSGAQPLFSSTPINTIGLMLIGGAGAPARDVWMDEVIIDTQPIGCTK
jgi:hypothetical protein